MNYNKVNLKNWKNKAIYRRKKITALNKRAKELITSRDLWKNKYKELKEQINLRNKTGILLPNSVPPKRYKYNNYIILLCLQLMTYSGSSLRSCRHFISKLIITFQLNIPIPSHTTIRLWVCKQGYYKYKNNSFSRETEIIIIADESITLGENRTFIILGINANKSKKKKTISFSDVKLIYFEVRSKWRKEEISEIINNLSQKYKIKYVISDNGSNLKGAYKLSKLNHVSDCTHVLAKALEHYFKNKHIAGEFLSMSGKLRHKWNLGKKTIFMPPAQRSKARYQNLSELIKWGELILKNWKKLPSEIQDALIWLKENENTFKEIKTLNKIISFISKTLKINGFNKEVENKIKEFLDKNYTDSIYFKKFLDEIYNYLKSLKKMCDEKATLFCCSDIIESMFGKIKYSVSHNSPFGMTEYSLGLATIGGENNFKLTKEAMEKTTEEDIKKWRLKNISPSLFQKKANFFSKKVGEKIFSN